MNEQQLKALRRAKAIEKENKEKIKKLCPEITTGSGIYLFYRTNEKGEKCVYIGQAKNLLQRVAGHLVGFKRKNATHIDKSLYSHKLYSENKLDGWRVRVLEFAQQKELDELEKSYINKYKEKGFKIYNVTGGGQLDKAQDIGKRHKVKLKSYANGKEYSYEKVRKAIAHLFDLHLDYTIKGKPNKNKEKALQKFKDFLEGKKIF